MRSRAKPQLEVASDLIGAGTRTVLEGVHFFVSYKRAEGVMPRTLRDYDRVLGDVLSVLGEDTPLDALKPATVRAYVHELLSRGWKPATVNIYVRVLRCWLRWLYIEGLLRENLAIHIKLLRVSRQYPHVLSEDQVLAILKTAKAQAKMWTGKRNSVIVLTLLDAMLRLKELINLELQDVNLQARSIRVRHGKGDKERVVFMGRRLTRAMREWLMLRGRYHVPGCDNVFITRTGSPLDPRGVEKVVQRLGKEANIQGIRCSPHTLRHTGATLFIRHGGDPFSLQRLLGHVDIQTTVIYVHMAGSALREVHAKASPVDRLFP